MRETCSTAANSTVAAKDPTAVEILLFGIARGRLAEEATRGRLLCLDLRLIEVETVAAKARDNGAFRCKYFTTSYEFHSSESRKTGDGWTTWA